MKGIEWMLWLPSPRMVHPLPPSYSYSPHMGEGREKGERKGEGEGHTNLGEVKGNEGDECGSDRWSGWWVWLMLIIRLCGWPWVTGWWGRETWVMSASTWWHLEALKPWVLGTVLCWKNGCVAGVGMLREWVCCRSGCIESVLEMECFSLSSQVCC